MVFSKSQYFKTRTQYANFHRILEALFISYTVLFVGYSVTDPDIALVLESLASIICDSAPHYILLQKGEINDTLRKYWETAYNLNVIEYDDVKNAQFIPTILQLEEEVAALRLDRGIF